MSGDGTIPGTDPLTGSGWNRIVCAMDLVRVFPGRPVIVAVIAWFIFCGPGFRTEAIGADSPSPGIEPASKEEVLAMSKAASFTHEGVPLRYRWIAPASIEEGRRYPLVLCLHGAGGRGADNEQQIRDTVWAVNSLAAPAVRNEHPAFILIPQCPEDRQWVDTDWSKGSYRTTEVGESDLLAAAVALVKATMKTKPVDPARVYVCGFSMGGYATWDVLARHGALFAAAVPICGAGDPSTAVGMKAIAVWAFHGDADGVVPVSGSREMVASLQAGGAVDVRYSELAGVGHNAWTPAWKSPELVEWLFSRSRGEDSN